MMQATAATPLRDIRPQRSRGFQPGETLREPGHAHFRMLTERRRWSHHPPNRPIPRRCSRRWPFVGNRQERGVTVRMLPTQLPTKVLRCGRLRAYPGGRQWTRQNAGNTHLCLRCVDRLAADGQRRCATEGWQTGFRVHPAGIEPATYGFEVRRSIQLSYECMLDRRAPRGGTACREGG